ncbi:MAG TPA: thioesterase family protein [Longimicrobiales bacterium]|nr:thioesterase family protein [Longimicrobiales bacterium]
MSDVTPRTTSSTVRVRYSETDQMGFVYHAHYLVWCEIGRTDFMRELGVVYAEVERQGLRLVVGEAHVRFRAPARYDDLVRIDTRIERVQSRAVTFAYELFRIGDDGDVAVASAWTTLVAIDERGTTRVLPPDLLAAFRGSRQG